MVVVEIEGYVLQKLNKGIELCKGFEFIGRERSIFSVDLASYEEELQSHFENSRNLVIGGAGTIGLATVRALTKFRVKSLVISKITLLKLLETLKWGGPY